jgi:hypothetical protein
MSLELEEKSIPFGALATNGERNRLALGVVSDDTLVREFREMEVAQRETNALDEFVFEMGVVGSFLRGDGRDEFGERQWASFRNRARSTQRRRRWERSSNSRSASARSVR